MPYWRECSHWFSPRPGTVAARGPSRQLGKIEILEPRTLLSGVPLTINATVDASPDLDGDLAVWVGSDGHDREVFLWDGITTRQLSNNDFDDDAPSVDGGQVVWRSWDGNDWEISRFDGANVQQLTSNAWDDWNPKVHEGQVVWSGYDGSDWEIFLYSGSVSQLTSNTFDDREPQTDSGQVIWSGNPSGRWTVFLHSAGSTRALSDSNYDSYEPQIQGGQAAWTSWDGWDEEVFFYDGTVAHRLTNNLTDDWEPQIADGQVVWTSFDGNDEEIHFYDGLSVRKLTDNQEDDYGPMIDRGHVVWTGNDGEDFEIFRYKGTSIEQLTANTVQDQDLRIDGDRVVWVSSAGGDKEVYISLTPAVTPLAPTTFGELPDLDPSARELWFRFQAVRDGYVSLQATSPDGAGLSLTIFDADYTGLAASAPVDGIQQVSWPAAKAGETFYFKVASASNDVDLRMVNLVRRDGLVVTIDGTAGVDVFRFDATAGYKVTVNGVVYPFALAEVNTFRFAGTGNNHLELIGGSDAETAELFVHRAAVRGSGYRVDAVNIASSSFDGRGGWDYARIHGSRGANTLVAGGESLGADPMHASLNGDGVSIEATAESVVAFGGGGRDSATLRQSADTDTFHPFWKRSRMRGDAYERAVRGFQNVRVHSEAITGAAFVVPKNETTSPLGTPISDAERALLVDAAIHQTSYELSDELALGTLAEILRVTKLEEAEHDRRLVGRTTEELWMLTDFASP